MLRAKAILFAALATIASAAAARQTTPPTNEPFVRCIECKNEGRLPCPKHDKNEMHLEDSVLWCSEIAGCEACAGAG